DAGRGGHAPSRGQAGRPAAASRRPAEPRPVPHATTVPAPERRASSPRSLLGWGLVVLVAVQVLRACGA
ncbi:hypothetical protein, partial [Cellulomonas shaoxiangyii]